MRETHVGHSGFTFWPLLVKQEGSFFYLPFILFTSLVKGGERGAELPYSAYGWQGTHSYNSAGPDAGCMEEVTANCVHPKLPPGVLQPVFKSATTSSYVIAAFNGS